MPRRRTLKTSGCAETPQDLPSWLEQLVQQLEAHKREWPLNPPATTELEDQIEEALRTAERERRRLQGAIDSARDALDRTRLLSRAASVKACAADGSAHAVTRGAPGTRPDHSLDPGWEGQRHDVGDGAAVGGPQQRFEIRKVSLEVPRVLPTPGSSGDGILANATSDAEEGEDAGDEENLQWCCGGRHDQTRVKTPWASSSFSGAIVTSVGDEPKDSCSSRLGTDDPSADEDARATLGCKCGSELGATDKFLYKLVRDGHCKSAAALLKQGHSCVNAKHAAGIQPIHVAARCGHVAMLRTLTAHRAIVDARTDSLAQPIHWSARWGRVDATRMLLDSGARFDAQTNTWSQPLHVAAFHGHVDVLCLLLDRRAHVNVKTKTGRQPIHDAAWGGQVSTIEFLLDRQADASEQTHDKRQPIHDAASCGNHKAVASLLMHRACAWAKETGGREPMHLAAARGHCKVLIQLLAQKARADVFDDDRVDPILLAYAGGHMQAVMLLQRVTPMSLANRLMTLSVRSALTGELTMHVHGRQGKLTGREATKQVAKTLSLTVSQVKLIVKRAKEVHILDDEELLSADELELRLVKVKPDAMAEPLHSALEKHVQEDGASSWSTSGPSEDEDGAYEGSVGLAKIAGSAAVEATAGVARLNTSLLSLDASKRPGWESSTVPREATALPEGLVLRRTFIDVVDVPTACRRSCSAPPTSRTCRTSPAEAGDDAGSETFES
mmetsp:Transcript_83889/g.234141  ORF Transcript_83889/g.234141 Transcript_83889/m.234141 type:complete len:727 (-) Transcript_83889:51-2231(-)